MRVGLLFGSFNPIHIGHLLLARYWLNETPIEQIWLVVSPHNPHKAPESLVAVEHRIRMARLAVTGEPAMHVSEIEVALPRPSYTIQTLEFLRRLHPPVEWVLLLGSDAACSLTSWRAGGRILSEWKIWVYPRKGTSLENVPKGTYLRTFPDAPRIDISATQIRTYCAAGKSIRFMVPPAVEAYIYQHGLYGAASRT